MPRPSQALRLEGFFDFKKTCGVGMCWVRGCSRKSREDRCLCHMHEMRRWRAKNERTADWCTLRDHARGRNIPFAITLDYWRGLTDAFGFYEAKADEVLTIDRVDPTNGYVEGNLRVVTVSLNTIKSNRERYLPEHVQHMLDRRRGKLQEDNARYLGLDPVSYDEYGEELPF
jgi:hypothetical protein